jgi:His-Xaa-Ser system radical SAM maturase HxsC
MVEEIKITWRAKKSLANIELFVGKVKEIIRENGIKVVLQGRELINNVDFTFVVSEKEDLRPNSISIISDLQHIELNDILLIKGKNIRSIYRVSSPNNSIFATIRCNSNCLMCSQPPLDVDDTYENFLVWDYAIDLMPKRVNFIGVTGGEPTLLGEYLVVLLNKLLEKYPSIIIDVLSNGRLQATDDFIDILSRVVDPNRVIFAIPLYSDIYKYHDYVVQAKDAFYQTITGIHKMAELGFPIEIRVVLHKLTIERLRHLAVFIHKNFPFAYHITFMGLEIIGYTKANKDLLLVDDNQKANESLKNAILYLDRWNYNTSIYNTPLCFLPNELRKYAKQSISDWKNSFHSDCDKCLLKSECSGFFSWNLKNAEVYPILAIEE